MPMLARPASTQSKIHRPVLASLISGRVDGTLDGFEDGPFEPERGADVGGFVGDDFDDGFTETAGGGPEPEPEPDAAAANSVSLGMSLTIAGFESVGGGTTPIAGIVTANASVPAGEVTNAPGLSETMSSGIARACMIAAASADADG